MKNSLRMVALLILLGTLSVRTGAADVFERNRKLGRGVNLGNALEAERYEGYWGVILREEYFSLIAQAGFRTVRVPVRWSDHAEKQPPYRIDEDFFKRVDWVLKNARKNRLNAVLNVHHYLELFSDYPAHRERFLSFWKQISERYAKLPDSVCFEILNEPNGTLTPERWNVLLKDAVLLIRKTNPGRTLVAGVAEWGGPSALSRLELPAGESNIIVTVHYYNPMLFTHQTADWVGPEYSTPGIVWPGPPPKPVSVSPKAAREEWVRDWFREYNYSDAGSNPASRKAVHEDLEIIAKWSEKRKVPVWIGEFGAYSAADMESRARWTRAVREECELFGFSWAYWEFCSGFGVYDPDRMSWRRKLTDALLKD